MSAQWITAPYKTTIRKSLGICIRKYFTASSHSPKNFQYTLTIHALIINAHIISIYLSVCLSVYSYMYIFICIDRDRYIIQESLNTKKRTRIFCIFLMQFREENKIQRSSLLKVTGDHFQLQVVQLPLGSFMLKKILTHGSVSRLA